MQLHVFEPLLGLGNGNVIQVMSPFMVHTKLVFGLLVRVQEHQLLHGKCEPAIARGQHQP